MNPDEFVFRLGIIILLLVVLDRTVRKYTGHESNKYKKGKYRKGNGEVKKNAKTKGNTIKTRSRKTGRNIQ